MYQFNACQGPANGTLGVGYYLIMKTEILQITVVR